MEAFRPLVFVYIFERFIFRFFEFFRRWYVGSARAIFHFLFRRLESLDRTFALKITILHFFSPLFGDRSIIGRVLGFIFRSIRIIIASVVYFILILLALAFYIIWIFIPVFVVVRIFNIPL